MCCIPFHCASERKCVNECVCACMRCYHSALLPVYSENHVTEFPKSIGNLRLLRYLVAHSNRLSSLPSSFASLTALRQLDLSRNKIRALPEDSIVSLELEVLRLIANDIKARVCVCCASALMCVLLLGLLYVWLVVCCVVCVCSVVCVCC